MDVQGGSLRFLRSQEIEQRLVEGLRLLPGNEVADFGHEDPPCAGDELRHLPGVARASSSCSPATTAVTVRTYASGAFAKCLPAPRKTHDGSRLLVELEEVSAPGGKLDEQPARSHLPAVARVLPARQKIRQHERRVGEPER